MNRDEIATHITENFAQVAVTQAFGYDFFFCGDDRMRPFATLVDDDNEYDRVSNLARPGVYRLNIGVSGETFRRLFGSGEVDHAAYDYAALNRIMPHPEYSRQHFVCVLNPSGDTLTSVLGLLSEAYALAEQRETRRARGRD